MVASDQVTSN